MPEHQPLRVVIADDEPLARSLLSSMVSEEPDFDLVGIAKDGTEARTLIQSLEPDLAILDIHMPGPSGIEIARSVGPGTRVVFATAYDHHAVTAFELHAVDYLLKPFGRRRFRETARRIREARTQDRNQAGRTDLERALSGSGPLETLWVRVGDRIQPLATSDISHVHAADDFVEVHLGSVGGRSAMHLVAVRLRDLAERLDPARFARIHRSWLVNTGWIREVIPDGSGRATLVLEGDLEIPVSRTGYRRLKEIMGT